MQDAIDTRLGGQVRLWRCLKGVRAEDLARELGVSPAYLALIEDGRGRLGAFRLHAAARTMGIPASTLIDGASHNWL